MVENTGKLYVVATPIGNLGDITYRAVEILRAAGIIVSEDTRRTQKLLGHLAISKPLISYYKDKERQRAEEIVVKLLEGTDIALVSDAGTPAVSDPGSILVKRCYEEKIPVLPIPGPSSLTTALSVSGFVQTPFIFLGFLPSRRGQRRKLLTAYARHQENLVFFESANRLQAAVKDCLDILGDRPAFLARELTKIHEELLRQDLSVLELALSRRNKIKGECVVIISGAEKQQGIDTGDLEELLRWHRDHTDMSLKEVVHHIAVDLNISRSQVYKKALEVFKGGNTE
ncbi:MAG: 16S rRNA (cytidine(1402)-2'-O)-methyltransferase [Desulfurivibrionaceae bacterium]